MTLDKLAKKIYALYKETDFFDYSYEENLDIKKDLSNLDSIQNIIKDIKDIKNEYYEYSNMVKLCDELLPELEKLVKSKKQNEALYGTYSEKLYKIIQMLSDDSNVDELTNLCDNLVRFCPEDAIKDLYFKYGYNEKETKLEEDLDDDFDLDDFDFRKDYDNFDKEPMEDSEDLPKSGSEVGVSTLLIDAINDEWDAINLYHVIAVNAEEEGYPDIADIIKDIANEENIHVGQLQAALATLSPDTNKIAAGEKEGENQLSEKLKKELYRRKLKRLKRI